MKKLSGFIIFAVVLLFTCSRSFAQDPLRFSKEVEAYKNADEASPPSQGCVLFYGSSSIRFWTSVAEDFPEYCVINRGFGGSEMSDANYYFNDLVAPYKPQIIVLYEGDNDLADHKKPEQILSDFKAFLDKAGKMNGEVKVFYLAAKPSPSRWALREQYAELNKLIGDFCETQKNLEFIDVYKPMIGENGKPEPDLYRADSLHMTPKGYALWTSIVDPYLKKDYVAEKVIK